MPEAELPRLPDILIVDDEKHVQDFFRRVLEKQGFTCEVAGDGKSAFRMTNRRNYKLVIMDIRMPDWHGIDAIVSMGLVNPNQKIIVVSGNLTDDVIKEIEDQPNVVGWVEKPIEPDRLLKLVKTSFEIHDKA